jgi:transposase
MTEPGFFNFVAPPEPLAPALTARDVVVVRRWYDGATTAGIAATLKVSRQRAEQIIAQMRRRGIELAPRPSWAARSGSQRHG